MNLLAPGIDRSVRLGGCEIRPEDSVEQVLQKLARVRLDCIAQWALLLTPEGAVLDANRAALAGLALSHDQALGKLLADLLPAAAGDQQFGTQASGTLIGAQQDLRAALGRAAAGAASHCTVEMRSAGGDSMLLDFAFQPIAEDDGQIVFLLAEGRDITEERAQQRQAEFRAEAAEHGLRRLQELLAEAPDAQRLAAIVESSDDAIVSKDLKGIVTSWNPGAERLFGYTAEDMIGQPITRIIPPDLYSDESRILATITRGERIEHFETIRIRKDGEPVEISLTVSPVRDQSGRIIGAAKIARDITQRKKVEHALRTTERLASVGRLAATVAHEINNPLEAVTNLIYLARNTEARDQAGIYLGMAEEELERISHLTKQTLGFYRETRGSTKVRIGELVNSLLSIFAPRMRSRGVRLITEIAEDVEVNVIPGEIRQVVANLVSNSIDALESGGQLRVRISPTAQGNGAAARGIHLLVADTGSGIPPAIRSQLFEPFFTTKKDFGTGLGLWICKSIVENHQGTIRVRSSTTPGKSGTVFSVFLPLATQQCIGPTEALRNSG